KELQKERRSQLASSLPVATTSSGIHYCTSVVALPAGELRLLVDELSTRVPSGIIALGTQDGDKAHIFVKVSQDKVGNGIKASELIKHALEIVEGSGGGKAEMAQGAGKAPQKIAEALRKLTSQLP
ncbi:MAG: alanine--tRNA ligase, partial [Verrucomicrobia bacterium]|nr:alanine--tRNA ligase [Verrucomicrobiota bacterium]